MAAAGFVRGKLKGQIAVEFMLVLAISSLIFMIALLTFQQGVGGIKSASGATRFVNSLEVIFNSADSLQPGSQRHIQLSIPPSLENFQQVGLGGGWYNINFEFNGQQWSRRVPYKLSFIPQDILYKPGEYTAVIYSRAPGDVVIQVVGS
ncbi:Uncharacterised protein [Candidatus Burarchaeum australiense]|nr:Uncharacterised protein [Candidatus Burarchaeum australiense]